MVFVPMKWWYFFLSSLCNVEKTKKKQLSNYPAKWNFFCCCFVIVEFFIWNSRSLHWTQRKVYRWSRVAVALLWVRERWRRLWRWVDARVVQGKIPYGYTLSWIAWLWVHLSGLVERYCAYSHIYVNEEHTYIDQSCMWKADLVYIYFILKNGVMIYQFLYISGKNKFSVPLTCKKHLNKIRAGKK